MFNKIICTALITSLLTSCAFVRKEPTEEPTASWDPDAQYNDVIGGQEAGLATVAYSQGNFKDAEKHIINALTQNPKHPQALLVGALLYEKIGRPNRARQYYEDLILVGGNETSLLGTTSGTPEKMSEIARKRLRLLTIQQSNIIVEDKEGAKVFTITPEASQKQGKSAMEEALFKREQKFDFENKAASEADRKAVELLFTDGEKNIISRFLIIKELAEKDLMTKEEFLAARQANIGGLLPLSNTPPAYGIDRSIPSADLLVERINALKEAVEARAITPREFSVERNLIIEAILPPAPRNRVANKAPSKDILSAAKDMRKVEVIYDMNLITAKEKDKEQKAIETYLGINKSETKTADVAPVAAQPIQANTPIIINEPAKIAESTTPAPAVPAKPAEVSIENSDTMPLVPAVSSPF